MAKICKESKQSVILKIGMNLFADFIWLMLVSLARRTILHFPGIGLFFHKGTYN
jgi:hypothetical protein